MDPKGIHKFIHFAVTQLGNENVIAFGIAPGGDVIALEGDFALSINRIPGTSLTQALEMQKSLERALLKIAEVKEVFTRMGTAEVATDAQPPSIGDGYVMLKPRKEWPDSRKAKADGPGHGPRC